MKEFILDQKHEPKLVSGGSVGNSIIASRRRQAQQWSKVKELKHHMTVAGRCRPAALGFLDISENRLFSMAVHDAGPRFAAEIRTTGIIVSTAAQLVAIRIHGVTVEFIGRVQQAGYKPEVEDLIKMRIHGVTPDFANDVRRMYGSASIEDLVRMRIHGVGVDFASDVRQMYATASIEDLVRLRIHGVTMDYIRNMQSRSKNMTLEQLVRLKIHGIE